MNTREAAKRAGLTYRQVDYLISQGIIKPIPVKKGKARKISDDDFWVIELAAALRDKGIGFSRINPAGLAVRSVNKGINFLYVHEGTSPFLVYTDGSSWEVETSIRGMSELFHKAMNSHSVIFYNDALRSFAEVQREQPNP